MRQHAEKLYQKGFLSYPRTETDQYDKAFDFATLIGKQTQDPNWGAFAQGCVSLRPLARRPCDRSLTPTRPPC